MNFKDTIKSYIKGAFPLILINTIENDRCKSDLNIIRNEFNGSLDQMDTEEWFKASGLSFYTWDVANGWRKSEDDKPIPSTVAPEAALRWVAGDKAPAGIYVMNNLHFYWKSPSAPMLIQLMRDFYHIGKITHKHLCMVGGSGLPAEIQPAFVVADYNMPDIEQITVTLNEILDIYNIKVSAEDKDKAISNLQGLTEVESHSAVYLSIVATKGKGLDLTVLTDVKDQMVKRTGYLECLQSDKTAEHVGGLGELKLWCRKVAKAFNNRELAKKYKLAFSKGCLIAGVSGTGKTLTAMVLAAMFGVKLYRLDVGRIFDSFVGATEKNTRGLFKVIEALGPCVILVDECEKALAGLASSNSSDAGVTARFISSMLYFMQENTTGAFFVFTANDITTLPPEIMRKGRVDEINFSLCIA